jgi:predicted Zn-dependent peptidase
VGAGLNREKAGEGITAILGELARVAADGVTEEELNRVKDQAEGRMAFMLESTNGTADDYGSSVFFHGKVMTPEDELAKLRAVTGDRVRHVAQDILRDERLNLAVIGPAVSDGMFSGLLTFKNHG